MLALWTPFVSGLVIAIVAGCGEGGTTDADYEAYFELLASELSPFESRIGTIAASELGLEGVALSESLDRYADELEQRATTLEALDAPGETSEPHRQFVIAFKYLAEAKRFQSEELRGVESGLTGGELVARIDDGSNAWLDLCHQLQDFALAREIEADLKCVTALHRR